jgi:hypothetical protein
MDIEKFDPATKWTPLDVFDIKQDGPARIEKVKSLLGIEKWIKYGHNHKKESLYISLRGWQACEYSRERHFMIMKIIKEIKSL